MAKLAVSGLVVLPVVLLVLATCACASAIPRRMKVYPLREYLDESGYRLPADAYTNINQGPSFAESPYYRPNSFYPAIGQRSSRNLDQIGGGNLLRSVYTPENSLDERFERSSEEQVKRFVPRPIYYPKSSSSIESGESVKLERDEIARLVTNELERIGEEIRKTSGRIENNERTV